MPQVPYDPVVQVPAEDTRIQRPQVDVPGAAFGTNIAQGVEKVGQTGEAVGNEIFQRAIWLQQLVNENSARETAINATQKMAEDWEQFRSTTTGTPEELDTFLKGLNASRAQFRQGLNPVAARMYDAEAANLQNRITMAAASHNAGVLKQRTNSTAKAAIDIELNTPIDLDNEQEWSDKAAKIERLVENEANSSVPRMTDEQVQDRVMTLTGQLYSNRIVAKARTDVDAAFNLLDRYEKVGILSNTAIDKLQKELWARNRDQTGTMLAESVWAPQKSQVQMEEEVKKQAAKYSHGDPDFEKAAVHAVQNKYTVEHQAIIHDQWQGKNDADTSINTGKYRNVQEFMADPNNADAISRAGPEYDAAAKIQTYWRSRDAQTSAVIKNKLLGEAHDDPQKFLGEDLWQDGLSNADRGTLMLRKKQLLAGGQPDPSVSKAAEAITNIFPNSVPQKGTDGYRQFLGALQGALDDYEGQAQRKLTRDDFEKIGRSILSTQPGTGWFGSSVGAQRVFEAKVPDEVLDHYRAQGMDDDQIAYNYHRALAMQTFTKLFGGVTSAQPK